MSLPTLNPTNLTEAIEFAKFVSTSGHIPKQFQGKPNDILVAIQWGYEIGLAPMQALQNIAVINGRPSLWGDSLIAVCKHHPEWRGIEETYIEEEDKAVCIVKRNVHGETEVTKAEFSYKDAQKARLANKPGPWQDYPKRMMQLRARGFALRDAFPDAIKGLITTEEAQDYPEENKPLKKVTGSDKDTNVIDDIKKKLNKPDGSEIAIKYTMHFIGGHKPIIYAVASDFILKFSDTLLAIDKLEKTQAQKVSLMHDLKDKNSETIKLLDEMQQAQIETEIGKYIV
tara:strand:- start:1144 stop:1998 length:855 start_codon:yes stop_codon:yes gene_type:complete